MATNSQAASAPFAPHAAIAIGLSLAVCVYRGYVRCHRAFGVQAVVVGSVTCLEVMLIAYLLAGRKKVRSGIRFAFWMALMSVFYLLAELGSH
jgi:hypothetical protein